MTSPGRVILINGAPSTGKTTIARALWEVLAPHWYRSWDDFRQGYLPRHLDPARGPWRTLDERPLMKMLSDGYRETLRAMALAGHDIISESVILPASIDAYLAALEGIPVFLVGVRCPVDVAEERERSRAPRDRNLGVPIDLRVPEFELVHSHGAYDVEVDTSVQPLPEIVTAIRSALATPPSPSAFERIRARRAADRAKAPLARTWPADWDDRMGGVGCGMCREGRPEETASGSRIFAGEVSDAYLMREDWVRGYTVVIWRGAHAAEIDDLSTDDLARYWREVTRVGRALRKHFAPAKLNYQVLGNTLPHVHTHIVPRYVHDPVPGRPLPFPDPPRSPQPKETYRADLERLRTLLR